MSFPKDFVWGAATASYQIEGAAFEDGRGLSVWDMLCRKPGAIWNGHSGAVACDHYHRYEEDVGLMKQIGLRGYRFSIAWPRVLPEGVGRINEKGMAFYDKLVDTLLAAKVEPYITLFHWDFPYDLFCRGGWLNRESADWFAEYAGVLADRLSDRVKHWMTHNESVCFIGLGHASGKHAPGLQHSNAEVLLAGHNAMLAHGRAVQALRARAKQKLSIGYAPVGSVRMPASDSPQDIDAARQAMFSVDNTGHWNNAWWMDPVFRGTYPQDGWKLFGGDVPPVKNGDMETICQPLDFCGVNIYGGNHIKAGRDGKPELLPEVAGHPLTAFKWAVQPESLRWGPRFLYERYKLPVYITENGMSNVDWVALDGQVHDPQRIDFTRRYLIELHKAVQDGADVRGYFHWSLMDNFEWAEGYKERFGMIHVDYPSGKRTPKDSSKWYAKVIQSNGAALSEG